MNKLFKPKWWERLLGITGYGLPDIDPASTPPMPPVKKPKEETVYIKCPSCGDNTQLVELLGGGYYYACDKCGAEMCKKIYLATPYSDPDPKVRQVRFEAVNKVAARLMLEGNIVFSPISHTHPIALAGDLPKGWEFWKKMDESFLEWCDELHIYCTDGWMESVGVCAEHNIAIELSKPVIFIEACD